MNVQELKEIEKQSRIYLDADKALIIRLDGRNVTKDKEKYDLTDKAGFVTAIRNATINALRSFRCEAVFYSVMDEISIIILDSRDFFRNFDDTNQLYCASIFLQRFLSFFRTFFSTDFGISMFNIPEECVPEYIEWRKKFGKDAAVVYAAKKFGIPYQGKRVKEVKKMLVEKEWYLSHTWFFEGILDTDCAHISEEVTIDF